MFGNLRSFLESSGQRLTSRNALLGSERKEGERLFEESDYAGAELHLAQAILESERRKESPDQRILLRLELAESQRQQCQAGGDPRKLAAAEETIREAHELALRTNERELTVQTLDALLVIAAERGNLDEVERLTREAAELEAKMKRRDPMQRAVRMRRLGLLQNKHGRLREASESLAESVTIYEQTLGEHHPATAHRFSELGAVHKALGNHEEALRCLRRAIRVHEQHGGLDSSEAVADLKMLTESLEALGDIDGAAAELERVLGLKLRVVGMNLDTVAEAQWELAVRYLGWRRFSRARELLMEAVGTFKRSGGARLARGYDALAQLEEDTGHYHDALKELAKAGKVWESVKAEHAPELIRNLEHRAFLFDLLRQHREAAFLQEQVKALKQATRWAQAG